MRLTVAVAAACLSMSALSVADPAQAAVRKMTTIPAQGLGPALQRFAKERDIQLIYRSDLVGDRQTSGVAGELTVEEALTRLLNGTGLTFQYLQDQGITIVPVSMGGTQSSSALPSEGRDGTEAAGKTKGFSRRFRLAQATTATSESAAASAIPSAAQDIGLEEITVTGSRLQVSGFATPTPVTVIGADVFEQRAPTDLSDIIRELPSVANSSGASGSPRAANTVAQNYVDLRGLGAVRTLVLIDGRRTTASGGSGSFDINMIPTALVERIEVVTGGASAAYGSDAVAGVANFILKQDLQGMTSRVQGGVSEHGDNEELAASLAFGTGFADDRGHFMIGIDASDNNGVGPWYAREYGREEPNLISFGNAGTATRAGLPAQGFVNGFELANNTPGGIITSGPLRGTAFNADGTPYAFQYGTVLGSNMYGTTSNYGNNPNSFFNISTPYSRQAGLARLTYDLGNDTTLLLEAAGGHTSTTNLLGVLNTTTTVTLDNPYLPAATRQAMLDAGVTSVAVGRTNTDLGAYEANQDGENLRLLAGLSGNFSGSWSWDGFYSHAESKLDSDLNGYRTADIAAAFGAVTVNGVAQCATVAGATPGCAPFNIFGVGNASAAAYDYLRKYQQEYTLDFKQDFVEASVRGDLLSLWAGPLAVAAGIDYRKDQQDSKRTGDSTLFSGGFAQGNYVDYTSSRNVKEVFAEANLPLASNVTAIQSLDLNAAARYTSYNDTGDYTTWKAGLTYEPNDEYRFRATRSRDIRAPTLFEQYGTTGTTISNVQNSRTGTTDTATFQKGPNPDLKAEIADTTTIGFALQPNWAEGLRLSVDYFDIEITGALTPLGPQDLIDGCYRGVADYCKQLTFDGTSRVTDISQQLLNLNQLKTSGFDLEADYRLPFDVWGGQFFVRALATNTVHQTTKAVTGVTTEAAGTFVMPKWRGTLNLTYVNGSFSTTASIRGFSHIKYSATSIGPDDPNYYATVTSPNCPGGTVAAPTQCANFLVASNSITKNLFPSATYLNWTVQYELPIKSLEKFQLFAVVNNVFDKQPPEYAAAATYGSFAPREVYDLIGRTYTAGARFSF